MAILIFITIINVCVTITANCRLIEKNTEKTTVTKPADNPIVRVTRALFEEDTINGFSKEDDLSTSSSETSLFDIRGPHTSINTKFTKQVKKISRSARGSDETPSINVSNSTEVPKQPVTQRNTLVKKPLPRFNGIDYDDDFQLKIIRSPAKYLTDSGEHEDEDFNIDDYDFDINHDEYSGRGKHLEPRIKNKHLLEQQSLDEQEPAVPALLAVSISDSTQSIIAPVTKIISKRNHIVEKTKKVADKTKEDYYDDYTTSTKSAERKQKIRELDDDVNEESTESKEYDFKTPRIARSSWNVANIEDKKSVIVTQFMDFLPTTRQLTDNNSSSTASH